VIDKPLREFVFPTGQVIQITQGDITQQEVDAIVNAANSQLRHGGGVAGVIVRRGGGEIQVASDDWVRKFGPVSHAEPAYTLAGDLPCRYIIHAVGPVWGEGNEDAKLAAAISGSLQRAEELAMHSLALPAISTGIFGFPKDRAAQIIFQTVQQYFAEYYDSSIELVRLVLFDQPTLAAFTKIWDAIFGQAEA